MTIKTFRK